MTETERRRGMQRNVRMLWAELLTSFIKFLREQVFPTEKH